MIWVDRDSVPNGLSTRRAIEMRLNSPGRWQPIVIFPEGKSNTGGLVEGVCVHVRLYPETIPQGRRATEVCLPPIS